MTNKKVVALIGGYSPSVTIKSLLSVLSNTDSCLNVEVVAFQQKTDKGITRLTSPNFKEVNNHDKGTNKR